MSQQQADLWNRLWSALDGYASDCIDAGFRRSVRMAEVREVVDAISEIVRFEISESGLMVGAMRYDGTRKGIEALAAWVKLGNPDDDLLEDPVLSWLTTDGVEEPHDVQLTTQNDDGFTILEPGDWVVRLSKGCFGVVLRDDFRTEEGGA